ncbi:unnamed protein product [Protopolystoma xenopodis]|uniref:ADAM cysteine-rich domain-containing protein n=1 Tax=Protopolystoma xenopodis TaxID=117903 RepID=A0A3S5CMD4_9PLAT|nr:unnamed protein product [Protopolystoma xenopodis]
MTRTSEVSGVTQGNHPKRPGTVSAKMDRPEPTSPSEPQSETGLCYQGRCPTRIRRCQAIWGNGAEPAEGFRCANSFLGGEGKSPVGDKIEDAACGKLFCQGGEPVPVLEAARMAHYVVASTKAGECK